MMFIINIIFSVAVAVASAVGVFVVIVLLALAGISEANRDKHD